ncbi:Nucleotidylyl transferase [Xylariomycetidae sp. FL2044]|nr:Nucleotidylyl transferase [Xylariomycetidae sp. FL2044]
MPSPASAETPNPMARLPPNLVALFTQALKTYQLSSTSFRVLCSLPSSYTSSSLSQPQELTPEPPTRPPNSILVLDSSFNPPTLAHQRMALSALANPHYEATRSRILLLLAINNADKAPKPAAFPQRLAMMYIFALDLLSAARARHGNTSGAAAVAEGVRDPVVDIAVTTEPYFHAKSAAIARAEFFRGSAVNADAAAAAVPEQVYLTGFDTLIRIFDPKYYPDNSMKDSLEPFFAHSRLRVTMRTDADWGDAEEQRAYLEGLRRGRLDDVGGRREWADRVEMVEGGGEVAISSTKVREAVARRDWEALKKLVNTGVADWIRAEGLYGEESR